MPIMKIPLITADVVQDDGSIFSGEDLEMMAQTNINYKYEPENRTLYAFIET